MGSSIVMLQNHFIVSLVVLRPFVFQCSAQTHQLRSIPITWLFQSVLTVHNTLRWAGPTKYKAWPWSCEYSVWPSPWKHGRELPMIFCAWDYRNEPIFRPQSQCDAEIPSVFAFQVAVHKQTNAVQYFVRHPISLLLNHSHGFEAFWNGLLSHSQWSCQFFLILTRVLLK